MTRVCAWCGEHLPPRSAGPDIISHGMCDSCLNRLRSTDERSLRDFLNRFDIPILLVNSEGAIELVNEKFHRRSGKDFTQLEGLRGGDAIECEYARLPEGCGRSTHCKACTIRRTVMDTFETGNRHHRVPVRQNVIRNHGTETAQFAISTEKKGDYVLLVIEEADTPVT